MAQAVIHRPKLLLLDEPASGLDPEARIALSGLFRALRDEGMTLVVSSHILAELEDYCTEMLIVRDGRVIEHRGAAKAETGAPEPLTLEFSLLGDVSPTVAFLQSQPGVSDVQPQAAGVQLHFSGTPEQQADLLAAVIAQGGRVTALTAHRTRLQDVYMALGRTAAVSQEVSRDAQ